MGSKINSDNWEKILPRALGDRLLLSELILDPTLISWLDYIYYYIFSGYAPGGSETDSGLCVWLAQKLVASVVCWDYPTDHWLWPCINIPDLASTILCKTLIYEQRSLATWSKGFPKKYKPNMNTHIGKNSDFYNFNWNPNVSEKGNGNIYSFQGLAWLESKDYYNSASHTAAKNVWGEH